MKIEYPIFILAKDDLVVQMHLNEGDLNCYEEVDIAQGNYEGWDRNGVPLRILFDKKTLVTIDSPRTNPDMKRLKEVLVQYANTYNSSENFIYAKDNDMVHLYEAVLKHIEKGDKGSMG